MNTGTKTKTEKQRKSETTGQRVRERQSAVIGTSFLWWIGFVKEVGFKSGMKKIRVMDDDRPDDDEMSSRRPT